MPFELSDLVVLLGTPHSRESGHVGAAGLIAGISYEHEDHGEHDGYAVMLDEDGLTYLLLPDGLASER